MQVTIKEQAKLWFIVLVKRVWGKKENNNNSNKKTKNNKIFFLHFSFKYQEFSPDLSSFLENVFHVYIIAIYCRMSQLKHGKNTNILAEMRSLWLTVMGWNYLSGKKAFI